MITPYKNRKLEKYQEVHVYRNLNNGLFSIRCAKTKLVLAHGNAFIIKNGVPVVNEKARQKVLEKKVRTVHAYIQGLYFGDFFEDEDDYDIGDEIYYNPYTCNNFINKTTEKAMEQEDLLFYDGKAHIIT